MGISKREITRITKDLNDRTLNLIEWKKVQEEKKKLILLLKKAESFIKE